MSKSDEAALKAVEVRVEGRQLVCRCCDARLRRAGAEACRDITSMA